MNVFRFKKNIQNMNLSFFIKENFLKVLKCHFNPKEGHSPMTEAAVSMSTMAAVIAMWIAASVMRIVAARSTTASMRVAASVVTASATHI